MSLTTDALQAVDNHWAVTAVGTTERDRGLELANARLVHRAVGRQLHLNFELPARDEDLLQRLATAYELAAIEGLATMIGQTGGDDALQMQFIAGAWRTFELRRLLPVPSVTEERIFHVLHLSALAYCGDRWSDLRRWFAENPGSVDEPSAAGQPWPNRVLYRLFACWVRLFRKKGWDDLDQIREIIAGLREDQKEFEKPSLNSGCDATDRSTAMRLIACYHWAKATELLARYVLQGEPRGIHAALDKHFEAATEGATMAQDAQLEILVRWLHAASRQMVAGSLWWVAHTINSRVTRLVGSITKHQGMFELLPPQRAALQEQGLLDLAATAVVVELPTSGGKTLLAQFRILQALNQFAEKGGWVAYVVPTRALGAQISRRLRRDFSPIGVRVEQLTGAVEIDALEEELLASPSTGEDRAFDILVATPEKLQLVIRNKKVERPLALVVMDEAHNLENATRGMRIEFLLATVKEECADANFLLLMPFVERADRIARWLAETAVAGRSISLGSSPWKPNEQIVGVFRALPETSVKGGWQLEYETLVTTRNSIHLAGTHRAGGTKPLPVTKSRVLAGNGHQQGFGLQAAAMATVFSSRGTSIAVGGKIPDVWSMAREASNGLPMLDRPSNRIDLVKKFLAAEISPQFELIGMLDKGIGVHHAGLSDEVRSLMEWLAEEGDLKVLCATTTLAQGINFPVSSVFMATTSMWSRKYPYEVKMAPREFWNLAGRAGRMNQDSVGVIGIAEANRGGAIARFVLQATSELVSRLVTLVAELDAASTAEELVAVIEQEQWEDFRCYVNHLVREIGNLERMLSNAEISLRNTFGYRVLQENPEGRVRAQKLLEATKAYARKITRDPGRVELADMTGFSFEGVGSALHGLDTLEQNLTSFDFTVERLFGTAGAMSDLFGIMLRVPQLGRSLEELTTTGVTYMQLAKLTVDWVSGKSIEEIARVHFRSNKDLTGSITDACRAIYRNLVNTGTWGISALSRLAGDFDSLSPAERRQVNLLPAMIYHGVRTEEGVLMRMNGVPRTIAENLGGQFVASRAAAGTGPASVRQVREFLASAEVQMWNRAAPDGLSLSGSDYREVWKVISGEDR